jgi:hypothetical protein
MPAGPLARGWRGTAVRIHPQLLRFLNSRIFLPDPTG